MFFWDLSSVVGQVALGLLLIFGLIVVARQYPDLRDRIDPVLPAAVRAFLKADELPEAGTLAKPARKALGSPGSADQKESAGRALQFSMGSTKQEVLAIQGSPTRQTDDTWHYGESEVYFTADRVIGWRISNSRPLRVR